MSDLFDFGFIAVDEDELDAVKMAQQDKDNAQEGVEATQDRLDRLFNAILPLLNNLKQNSDKDYILWPDRLAKVEEFESKLMDIYRGAT